MKLFACDALLCSNVFDVFQIIILQGERGLEGTKGEKVSSSVF